MHAQVSPLRVHPSRPAVAERGGRRRRQRGVVAWRLALFTLIAVVLLLSGCASGPAVTPTPRPDALVHDALFPRTDEVIDPERVLAISPEMKAFIRGRALARPRLVASIDMRDVRDQLLDALYTRGELKLDYDAEMTRTASEAFDARSGNCLSLALMTAAFARELGVPVVFRHIYQEEQWSRVGDLQVISGHVNIGLGRQQNDFKVLGGTDSMLVVDFLPGAQIRMQRAMELDETTIVAMYMNNRAAEWLAQGQVDRAYWWARSAWLYAPRFTNALNTLGVIYRRHGDVAPAEAAFREVLRLEPGNTQAMGNIAQLLRSSDRLAEAQQWEARLAQLQPYPPFKFFDLGVAAMKAGDYAKARDLFRREIDRSSYYHEFWFWLALSNVGLGRWDEVSTALAKAEETAATIKQRQLYAAKQASLRAKLVH